MNESLEDTIAAALKATSPYEWAGDIDMRVSAIAVAVREWEAARQPTDEEVEAAGRALFDAEVSEKWASPTITVPSDYDEIARAALVAAYRVRG